jgi:hypothetical protein
VSVGTGRPTFDDARDPALGVQRIQGPVDCGPVVVITATTDEESHALILLKYSCKSLFFAGAYSGLWWVNETHKI